MLVLPLQGLGGDVGDRLRNFAGREQHAIRLAHSRSDAVGEPLRGTDDRDRRTSFSIPSTISSRGRTWPCAPGESRTSGEPRTPGGNCVEVALNLSKAVAVRDSKRLDGPAVVCSPAAWRSSKRVVKHDPTGF
ncbi:DUF397 domain-containing protein [Sphaerisporangium sp. NPDC004334]